MQSVGALNVIGLVWQSSLASPEAWISREIVENCGFAARVATTSTQPHPPQVLPQLPHPPQGEPQLPQRLQLHRSYCERPQVEPQLPQRLRPATGRSATAALYNSRSYCTRRTNRNCHSYCSYCSRSHHCCNCRDSRSRRSRKWMSHSHYRVDGHTRRSGMPQLPQLLQPPQPQLPQLLQSAMPTVANQPHVAATPQLGRPQHPHGGWGYRRRIQPPQVSRTRSPVPVDMAG